MRKPNTQGSWISHKLHLDSLEKFISSLPPGAEFNLEDWLQTLKTRQLRYIERDALRCCEDNAVRNLEKVKSPELIDVALMAFAAENDFELDADEARDRIDSLLIGLAVAACVERLRRLNWLIITSRIGIVLAEPRPYRVTYKGLTDGVWSHAPMTLWILGANLIIH